MRAIIVAGSNDTYLDSTEILDITKGNKWYIFKDFWYKLKYEVKVLTITNPDVQICG